MGWKVCTPWPWELWLTTFWSILSGSNAAPPGVPSSAAGPGPFLLSSAGWRSPGKGGSDSVPAFWPDYLLDSPHFWSLAIFHRRDYSLAGLRVIPSRNAALWITVFAFLLVGLSFLLIILAGLSYLSLVAASVLGTFLLVLALRLQFREGPEAARSLFLYSIVYLMCLFGALLVDGLRIL